MNKAVDINRDLLKLGSWNGKLSFWGVNTSNRSGKHQSLKWCNPRSNGRGDDSVYNRLIWAKGYRDCLRRFIQLPDRQGKYQILYFFLTLAVKTVGLWQCYAASDLFVLT